jgi:methyl-accepting chemotaxis protein
MLIACPECAKQYRVDPAKFTNGAARFRCKACGHVMTATLPSQAPAEEYVPRGAGAGGVGPVPFPPSTGGGEDAGVRPPPPEEPLGADGSRRRGLGLRTKVFLLLLFFSLEPLFLYSALTIREEHNQARVEAESGMTMIALGLASEVNQWIDGNVRVLRILADTPEIASLVADRQEPLLRSVQAECPWMYLVFTLDPNGVNVGRSDGGRPKDYSDRSYYTDVMAGKDLAWQTLVGKTSKKPALVLAVPIRAGERPVGVVAAAMELDEVARRIATWRRGETGFAFLVDDTGKVVAHPNAQFVTDQEDLKWHPLVAAYRSGQSGVRYFQDEAGRRIMGYVTGTHQGWVLALQQDEEEVLASKGGAIRFGYLVLVIAVLSVTLAAWLCGRAVVRPLRRLTDVANRISLGELDTEIPLSRKDEIGDLARAIARLQTSVRLSLQRLRSRRGIDG